MKKIPRSKELQDQVSSLYLSGLTIALIAVKLKLSRSLVQRILVELDIPKRPFLYDGSQDQHGSHNGNWKGGTRIRDEYVLIWKPGYHRTYYAPYAKRADLVLEEKLGRLLLPNEVAHHINEIKSDDSPDNLEVKDGKTHTKDHHRARILDCSYIGCHVLQPRKSGRFSK